MTLKDYLNAGDRFAANCGAIFTLADLVFAALVNQSGYLTFSINSTIYYHVSAKEGDTLRAEGKLSCDHHRIPSVEVAVTNQDGVRIATFTGQAYTGRSPLPVDALQ